LEALKQSKVRGVAVVGYFSGKRKEPKRNAAGGKILGGGSGKGRVQRGDIRNHEQ